MSKRACPTSSNLARTASRVRVTNALGGTEIIGWREFNSADLDTELRAALHRPDASLTLMLDGAMLARVPSNRDLDLTALYRRHLSEEHVAMALDLLRYKMMVRKRCVFASLAETLEISAEAAGALANDDAIAQMVVAQKGAPHFRWLSARQRGKKALALQALDNDCKQNLLRFMSDDLRADKDVVLAAVIRRPQELVHAADDLLGDVDIVAAVVKRGGLPLRPTEKRGRDLCDNRSFLLALIAATQEGWPLNFASETLRGDREVVAAAMSQNIEAFRWATADLRSDRRLALWALSENPALICHVAHELQQDPDVVAAAESGPPR